MNVTNIPSSRVDFIDPRTGLMSREWYRFFLNLFTLTGSGNNQTSLDELQLSPPAVNTTGGTVTSVAALTLGTSGTDVSSTVANSTTTPVITLNLPTASATNRGALSATDWTTFNNKGTGSVTSVSGTTDRVTSTGGATPVIDLASGIATPGTTGSATLVPVVTIDTYGRVTSITTAANPQGTVTSVTGTAPVVSSGGATPAISMAAANTTTSGYLTSTDWNTFNSKGSGTVTSVTGTAPVVSSGGATPAISMAAATSSVNGYLTSTDWSTFNSKGSGSVTSVAATVPSFLSVAGSPITTSGTLALTYSGTALPVANGGTGVTTSTGTTNVVLSNSPTIVTPTINAITSASATALTLQSAGATAITANTSQNVGVGTSAITAKLHAYATSGTTLTIGRFEAAIGSYTGTSLIAANTLGPSSAYNLFSCLADSDGDAGGPFTEFLVRGDGIVSMPAYGAGAATFSAAGVISSVSDETWKIKDGVPVDTDSMLKKLEPGYWYYNDEKKETFGADRQLGFYAQNVNAAIGPEAAPIPEKGKPWGYHDRSVLAVTVMSLQKALATIESLTARIAALESK